MPVKAVPVEVEEEPPKEAEVQDAEPAKEESKGGRSRTKEEPRRSKEEMIEEKARKEKAKAALAAMEAECETKEAHVAAREQIGAYQHDSQRRHDLKTSTEVAVSSGMHAADGAISDGDRTLLLEQMR